MESWKIYYVLGIVGLLIYLFLFIIGAAYLTIFQPEDYSREDSVTAGTLLISVCTPMLFLPSIIFFIIGWRGRSKFMMYEDVANVLKAYRRIKISELARKFNKPEYEAEKLVMECIERNLVNGYMDRQAQEFFTRDAMHQMPQSKSGWKCSACGAYNDSVILPGETAKCGYCGKIEAPKLQPRPQPQMPYREPAATTPLQPHQMAAPMYGSTNCNRCGTPMVFVSQYGKWYCNRCGIYA